MAEVTILVDSNLIDKKLSCTRLTFPLESSTTISKLYQLIERELTTIKCEELVLSMRPYDTPLEEEELLNSLDWAARKELFLFHSSCIGKCMVSLDD